MNNLEDLSARSQNEVSYDNMVLSELRNGKNISQAIQIAATQYPDETWFVRTDEDIDNLRKHYLFLAEHDEFKQDT